MPKQHYFDHAATTPLDKKALSAMLPYFSSEFGNPSNLYGLSRRAKCAVEDSTLKISAILNCKPEEIIYTGSATEADNLAIQGVAKERSKDGKKERLKIITSQIEHKGILAACGSLEKEGFDIVRLPVSKEGIVNLEALKKELDEDTLLVSITYADSETGTIQPIKEISKILKNFRESRIMNNELTKKDSALKTHNSFPYLHTDATQAALYMDIDIEKLGTDLMTLSAHKLHGPKGIGALYVRKGVKLSPIIHGGGSAERLRSGTENVPGIVGFAKALEICQKQKKKEGARVKKLRDALEKGILKSIPKTVINGSAKNRLPNFLNVSILDVEGEALLLYLDELGISVSTGSACNSLSLEPSYVLSALGNPYEYVHGSLRLTLGRMNSLSDVRYVLKNLPKAVQKLRAISPLNLRLGQTKKISDPRAFVGNQTPHFVRNPKFPASAKASAGKAK